MITIKEGIDMKTLATVVIVCLIAAAAVAVVPMFARGQSITTTVELPEPKVIQSMTARSYNGENIAKFEDEGNVCYVVNSRFGNAISCVSGGEK